MKSVCFFALMFCAILGRSEVVYLDELPLDSMSCGLRLRPQRNKCVAGGRLRMGSATNVFARGVGTHVESVMVLRSNGRVKEFEAVVGIDWAANEYTNGWDSGKNYGGAKFRVYADGRIVAESDVIKPQDMPRPFKADIAGAKDIMLEATDCGDSFGYRFGHADWADARFVCEKDAVLEPHPDKTLTAQLGVLTPEVGREPCINGPSVLGVRPNHDFLFRLPVSGVRPMHYCVSGLPEGVALREDEGILSGRISRPGNYPMTVFASNSCGIAERTLELKVGDRICLTPPMGWNSWNLHETRVTDADVRLAARKMVESGLADHGWCYVNIDDGWCLKPDEAKDVRTEKGVIICKSEFPDMKNLTDYIHSLGLKAGIYSSPGEQTCGHYAGSLGFEDVDAETYAQWGFDYLKYDWCGYGKVFRKETKDRPANEDDYAKPYRQMSKALRAQDRDIVYAMCQYGMGNVQAWGREAGGQVFRSNGDLKDSWGTLMKTIDAYDESIRKHTGPGFWCDPDMLVVGYLDTDKGLHWTDLSPNEQYTHISLWCMLNAPLLLGCDIARLDAFTKNLLVNDEVLSVNQDPLGRSARRVVHADDTDIWVREIVDEAYAVVIVNRFPFSRQVKLEFRTLGLDRQMWVKDLWRRQCLGLHEDHMTFDIPGHASIMLKLVPSCRGCEGKGARK